MTKLRSGLVKERNLTAQRLQPPSGRYLSEFCTNNLHCKHVNTNKVLLSHYQDEKSYQITFTKTPFQSAIIDFQLLKLLSNQQLLLIFDFLILAS